MTRSWLRPDGTVVVDVGGAGGLCVATFDRVDSVDLDSHSDLNSRLLVVDSSVDLDDSAMLFRCLRIALGDRGEILFVDDDLAALVGALVGTTSSAVEAAKRGWSMTVAVHKRFPLNVVVACLMVADGSLPSDAVSCALRVLPKLSFDLDCEIAVSVFAAKLLTYMDLESRRRAAAASGLSPWSVR